MHHFAALYAGGLYSAKYTVRTLCEYMGPARDALAMGSTEVKLDNIPEGKSVTFTWRGKPLFVRHRTGSEIAKEEAVPLSELRDPQTDSVLYASDKIYVSNYYSFCSL